MRSLLTAGLALAALLVAACGGASAPASSAAPSAAAEPLTAETLAGHVYLSTGADGRDLVEGSQVRLSFEPTRLGASAGCNQMSGEYEVVDGVIKIGPMAMTEMACEEPLMQQDDWLSRFIPGATVALDGTTLTLAKDGVTLTLEDAEVATPDKPVAGTRWILDGVITGESVSSVPAGSTATMQLQGATIVIDSGCNTGRGDVRVTDASMSVGAIAMTMKACADPALTAVETAMTTVLQGEVAYAIDADTLTLMNGANGLTFTAEGAR